MENVREVLANAIWAHTNMNIKVDSKDVVKNIIDLLEDKIPNIKKANENDVNSNNGFKINVQLFKQICKEFGSLDDSYRKVISVNKDKNDYLEGIQTDKIGTVCVVYDGNTYCLLELAIKCLLTHNALILVSKTDYMKQTNEFIISLIKNVLNTYEIDKNLIQTLYTYDIEKILSNSASINKVIAIGNKDFQEEVKKLSKIEVVTKGYNSYEMYIEDLKNIELILKIIKEKKDLQIYVKKGLSVPFDDYIEVANMKEVIGIINFTTSGYSSAIFTENPKNASKFMREVKTKNISVNTNPLTKNMLDLDINVLLNTKNMKYPIPLTEGIGNNEFNFKESEEYKEEKRRQEDQKILEENQKKLEEKEEQLEYLKHQLEQSHSLVRKYIDIFRKSFLSRLFAKLKKSDLDRDIKLLP